MKSWYVVHRPQLISELDQEQVRRALSSFVKSSRFPHALLFTGPKGTGKTSAARIVAKILNCDGSAGSPLRLGEPCNKCTSCREITEGSSLAVVELDAASHRGIEDIRVLRDAVKLAPAGGKTKVYIIDEAHMLTTEAANALLKTLEEPPSHVVFILATTEPYKVPETIKSRTTIIQFGQAKKDELLRSLARVAQREKLEIEDRVLELIADRSEGSFRDGIKLLEQLALSGKVTKETIEALFYKKHDPRKFLDALIAKDVKTALSEIIQSKESGVPTRIWTVEIIELLRGALLKNLGIAVGNEDLDVSLSEEEIKQLISLLMTATDQMRSSPIPELPLELVVVEWCAREKLEVRDVKLENEVGSAKKQKSDISPRSEAIQASHITPPTSISDELWRKLLAEVKTHNHSIEALLRSSRPLGFDGGTLIISVYYPFHKEKLEEEVNRRIVEDVAGVILGGEPRIVFELGERPQKQQSAISEQPASEVHDETQKNTEEDVIKAAEEIFGGEFKN